MRKSNNGSLAVPAPEKKRVFLVDDHPVTREGLAALLEGETDLTVCGQAAAADDALLKIPGASPHIVIVDVALPGKDGIELLKELARLCPQVPTIVLSIMDEAVFAKRAIHAGARGYVMKIEPMETILQAIRDVLAGEIYLSRSMRTELLLGSLAPSFTKSNIETNALTDRELEVFRLIGEGWRPRDIARSLDLSVSTVDGHRAHIKSKLGLKSGSALMRHAILWLARQQA